MASTWKKGITAVALATILGGHMGMASACPNRRRPAAPATAPVAVNRATVAPAAAAPVTIVPPAVAPAPIGPEAVESPVVAAMDLELYDIRRVDDGNDEQGPSYRVIVKNLSRTAASEITVALLASMEKDSDDNVSVLGSLESLEAGATKSIDLRLPKGSEVLTYLTAVVALTDGTDANETDNVATYERDTVLAAR
jgi:hypothetical protein